MGEWEDRNELYKKNLREEHELNLKKIQTLDFSLSRYSPRVFHPAIIFSKEVCESEDDVKKYGIKIQVHPDIHMPHDWSIYGGKYLEKLPFGQYDKNVHCQFTLEDFKKALKATKNRLLLYWKEESRFCVALTPQEVEKIIELIEITQKEFDEEDAKRKEYGKECDRINEQVRMSVYQQWNDQREQRQKLFENQDNGV